MRKLTRRAKIMLAIGVGMSGLVVQGVDSVRDEYIVEELDLPAYPGPELVVESYPPPRLSTPRNWWGTRDNPIVWPEE